jgi:hypothetical protein
VKLALLGDVGGHLSLFADALHDLGVVVADGWVPEDLTVIQLGDLIDRGPDAAGCVALADRCMRASAGRWIQVFGNHEGNRIGGPRFWDEELDPIAEATLRRWWDDGDAYMAVAISSLQLGDVLASHGGIVRQLWEVLGRNDAATVAATCNRWVGCEPDLAFSPGALLRGTLPGPAWAAAGEELYASWVHADVVPFSQVHGHSTVCDWRSSAPRRGTRKEIVQHLRIDGAARHEIVELGEKKLIGIDPAFGVDAGSATLQPYILHGDVVAPAVF